MERLKFKRYSYKFVKEYADLTGQKLYRCSRLGDRANEYYVFFLNDKEYKSLKEVVRQLFKVNA